MDQRLSSICSYCDRAGQFKRMKMYFAVILICIAMAVTSAPTNQYTINVDGPEGRHVQMGEPGKSVSGYYTSRSLDGLMEYKTMYEADEKGFRATGDHLPLTGVVPAVRSLTAPEGYVFKYESPGSHSHYMMGEPGKSVQGSFTYTDAEGRSQRVDYEADENGYRVKPTKEEVKPIEIASQNDGQIVIAAPAVTVVAAEPIPEVEKVVAPVAAEPAPAPAAVAEVAVAEAAASRTINEEEKPVYMKYFIPAEVAKAAEPESRIVMMYPAEVDKEAAPESRAVEQAPPAMMYYPKDLPAVEEPSVRTIVEETPVPMMYYPKDLPAVDEPSVRTIAEETPVPMMYYPKDLPAADEPSVRTIPEETPVSMMYYPKEAEVVIAAEPEGRTVEQVQPAMMYYPKDLPAVDEPATRTIAEETPVPMMYYPKDPPAAEEPSVRTIPEETPVAMMYYPKDPPVADEPATRTIPEETPVAMMYYPKNLPAVDEPATRTIAEVAEVAPVVETVASSDPAPVQSVAVAESKVDKKLFYALPIAFPGTHYYGLPSRIIHPALPTFHYATAPYPYAYGYHLMTRGSYVYVH